MRSAAPHNEPHIAAVNPPTANSLRFLRAFAIVDKRISAVKVHRIRVRHAGEPFGLPRIQQSYRTVLCIENRKAWICA